MSVSFARFLSVVLHPVFMPTYAVWFLLHNNLYFSFATAPVEQIALYLIVVVNTLLMPLLAARILLRKGWISSLEMEDRLERTLPYGINIVFLLLSYYLVNGLHLPRIYSLVLLGAALAVTITLLINLKWKISVHMVGIGGFLGILFAISTLLMTDLHIPIVIVVLFSGLLGTARLRLGSHNAPQVYVGLITGMLCEFLILLS